MSSEKKISPKKVSPQEVRLAVKEGYGLVVTCEPELLDGGVENGAWLLQTAERKYIAKLFAEGKRVLDRVREEALLYSYLINHNVHVPEIIPDSNGNLAGILSFATVHFPTILMKYEDIHRMYPRSLTEKELKNIAVTIATMHTLLREYPRKKYIRVWDINVIQTLSSEDFDRFLISPNATLFLPDEIERLKIIHQKAIRSLSSRDLEISLTQSVLHGDLALGHMQKLSDGSIYLFDFSDFTYGPVALDLAVLLFNFYREGDITFAQWKEMKSSFIRFYSAVFPLTDEDMKTIDTFMVSKMLEQIRYLDLISLETKQEVDAEGNKKRYALLEYIITQSNHS